LRRSPFTTSVYSVAVADEKMDRLMEQHAAKVSKPKEKPLKDLVDAWELEEDREARLVCPQCGKSRIAEVPKSWWALAEKRGEKAPFWRSPCECCIELEGDRRAKEDKATEVSEALELQLPTMGE